MDAVGCGFSHLPWQLSIRSIFAIVDREAEACRVAKIKLASDT